MRQSTTLFLESNSTSSNSSPTASTTPRRALPLRIATHSRPPRTKPVIVPAVHDEPAAPKPAYPATTVAPKPQAPEHRSLVTFAQLHRPHLAEIRPPRKVMPPCAQIAKSIRLGPSRRDLRRSSLTIARPRESSLRAFFAKHGRVFPRVRVRGFRRKAHPIPLRFAQFDGLDPGLKTPSNNGRSGPRFASLASATIHRAIVCPSPDPRR